MKPWKRIEPTTVTKVGWRTIVRKTFERPDGLLAEYDTYDPIGSQVANVIALTPDNKVIIAEQFRQGPEKYCQELPGGIVDKGEDPKAAALRELREEVGYEPGIIESLGATFEPYRNMTWNYYLARDCKRVSGQDLDDGEFVNIQIISIDQLLENARTGQMCGVAGLFLAYEALQKIKMEANIS